jgi:hypothetical protein
MACPGRSCALLRLFHISTIHSNVYRTRYLHGLINLLPFPMLSRAAPENLQLALAPLTLSSAPSGFNRPVTLPQSIGFAAALPNPLSASRNPFRIIFLDDPHPLNPMESYSCKKQGGGGVLSLPLSPSSSSDSPRVYPEDARGKPNVFMRLLHTAQHTRGWGCAEPPRYSLLTIHYSLPFTRAILSRPCRANATGPCWPSPTIG